MTPADEEIFKRSVKLSDEIMESIATFLDDEGHESDIEKFTTLTAALTRAFKTILTYADEEGRLFHVNSALQGALVHATEFVVTTAYHEDFDDLDEVALIGVPGKALQ